MSRLVLRLVFGGTLALLGLTSAQLVHASALALHDIEGAAFATSQTPALLGPINELGRNGWQCTPESAAAAKRARDAELPAVNDR